MAARAWRNGMWVYRDDNAGPARVRGPIPPAAVTAEDVAPKPAPAKSAARPEPSQPVSPSQPSERAAPDAPKATTRRKRKAKPE